MVEASMQRVKHQLVSRELLSWMASGSYVVPARLQRCTLACDLHLTRWQEASITPVARGYVISCA